MESMPIAREGCLVEGMVLIKKHLKKDLKKKIQHLNAKQFQRIMMLVVEYADVLNKGIKIEDNVIVM